MLQYLNVTFAFLLHNHIFVSFSAYEIKEKYCKTLLWYETFTIECVALIWPQSKM